MLGTVVNAVAILIGGSIGIIFGHAFPEKIKSTVIQGIGLAILLIGGSMAFQTKNPLIVISSLVLGAIIGEWIDIELRLLHMGQWLELKLKRNDRGSGFVKAFITTSLMYCVGAMAIMGSLESGLTGVHNILFAKSMLDGITAMIFASTMGIGVLVSALPVFLYQGTITMGASMLQGILSSQVIAEMSATGGLLILGIGFNILGFKEIKVGNLLPSVFIVVPITLLFAKLHFGL